MINNTSAKLTIRQSNIHTERDERLGWTARGVWPGLTEGLLDNSGEYVFTATYISQIAMLSQGVCGGHDEARR